MIHAARTIEPGIAIGYAPQRNAVNLVRVLVEQCEHLAIALRLFLLNVIWQSAGLTVIGARLPGDVRNVRGRVPLRGGNGVHVQFSDHHLYAQLAELDDGLLNLRQRGRRQLVVMLGADAVNLHAARLQFLDEFNAAGALGFVLQRIIVVIKLGIRIRRVGELERL